MQPTHSEGNVCLVHAYGRWRALYLRGDRRRAEFTFNIHSSIRTLYVTVKRLVHFRGERRRAEHALNIHVNVQDIPMTLDLKTTRLLRG